MRSAQGIAAVSARLVLEFLLIGFRFTGRTLRFGFLLFFLWLFGASRGRTLLRPLLLLLLLGLLALSLGLLLLLILCFDVSFFGFVRFFRRFLGFALGVRTLLLLLTVLLAEIGATSCPSGSNLTRVRADFGGFGARQLSFRIRLDRRLAGGAGRGAHGCGCVLLRRRVGWGRRRFSSDGRRGVQERRRLG